MKRLLTYTCIAILVFMQFGCFGVFKNNFESEYSHVYSNQNDDVSERIDINGFYYAYSADSLKNHDGGILFFNDGTCDDFLFKQEVVDSISDLNNLDLMSCIMTYNKHKKTYSSGSNGYYKIQGDTITVYSYYYYMLSYSMNIYRYIILDRQSIKLIDSSYKEGEKWYKIDSNITYYFHPAHNLPTSDYLWLKQKKWFWKKNYNRQTK